MHLTIQLVDTVLYFKTCAPNSFYSLTLGPPTPNFKNSKELKNFAKSHMPLTIYSPF